MKLHYDPQTDSLYLRLVDVDTNPTPPAESEEVRPGIVLDYDAAGRIVGIEVRSVRTHLPDADVKKLQLEVA